MRTTTGTDFDLDASALSCGADGKVVSDQHFVFYNNLTSPDGSVVHQGDNRTGEGDGDDEVVEVDLAGMGADVDKIVFPVSIDDADARGQNFGQVTNAFIRVVNADNGTELARYDLSEDASSETAMVFGELYRNAGEWKFRADRPGLRLGPGGHRARLRRQPLTLSAVPRPRRPRTSGRGRLPLPDESHPRAASEDPSLALPVHRDRAGRRVPLRRHRPGWPSPRS